MTQRWAPAGGRKLQCREHKEVFEPPHVCPGCVVEPGDPDEDEADEVEDPRLDGVSDQELRLARYGKYARRIAGEVLRGTRACIGEKSEPLMVAAKYLDISIKAIGRAAEMAQRREDWAITKRLERQLRRHMADKEKVREQEARN